MMRSMVGVVILVAAAMPQRASAQAAAPVTPAPAAASALEAPAAPATPAGGPAVAPASAAPVPAQSAPPAVEPPPRHGLTFEAAIGAAQVRTSAPGGERESGAGPSLALGLGWWVSPQLVLGVRVIGSHYADEEDYGLTFEVAQTTQTFVGINAQYWASRRLWLGIGLGVGESRIESEDAPLGFPIINKGAGLDLRFGGSLVESAQSSLNVSLEVTAIRIDDDKHQNQYTATSVALLLGYQYL